MKDSLTKNKVFPLRKLIASLPPEQLSEILSSFSCKGDKDVESFLREKAVVQEKKHVSRTYLMFTDDADRELVAYFTVAISSMDVTNLECSNELRKKMNINNGLAQSYLIGQVSKRDGGRKGLGRLAMQCAMDVINGANLRTGCRVVRLDCRPPLVKYYTDNGFANVGKSMRDGLHRMVRIIDPRGDAEAS